jgi:hypothetical protein
MRAATARHNASEREKNKTKNPDAFASGFVVFKTLAVSYSHMAAATLSSALSRFTSVFGMGTGGSNSLWPPGKLAEKLLNQSIDQSLEFGL